MEENDLIATVTKYIVSGICVIILFGMASCQIPKYQLRKMVEAGVQPLEAGCAMKLISGIGEEKEPVCAQLISTYSDK